MKGGDGTELLFESKRRWLLSYIIGILISGVLYGRLWDYPIARTIGIMLIGNQIIMFVFFWVILIFSWKIGRRTIANLIYLGITIYEGVNGYLVKWYIIVPLFIVTEVYMLWNLGGVVNCIVASPYRDRINGKVDVGRYLYNSYIDDLDGYNEKNDLGFFSKVRKRREPNWKNLAFNYTALDMFCFKEALVEISSLQWDRKESELDKINSSLSDKLDALDSNQSIHEEKSALDRIRSKAKSVGLDTSKFDASSESLEVVRKKNVKSGKVILKRKL